MNAPNVIDVKEKLGQRLLDKGLISIDQLDIALTEQKKNGRLLGEVLVGLGFVSESVMRDALSQVLGIASVDLASVVPDKNALDMIDKETAERYTIVPVSFEESVQRLSIAMKNASDLMILDRVHAIVGRKIQLVPMVAGESEIKKAIDQFYGYELSVDGILREIETGEIDYQSERLDGFDTLRQYGGTSGFLRRVESEHDVMDGGHAGTGISIAEGLALARDARGSDERIAVVVGDAALMSGLSLEALNDIGHRKTRMLILLNDNEMSISPSVGAVSQYLSRIKLSSQWRRSRRRFDSDIARIEFQFVFILCLRFLHTFPIPNTLRHLCISSVLLSLS